MAYLLSKLSLIMGLLSVDVPRDRASTFDLVLLPKRQTRMPGLDDKILSLYAKGMSLSDIQIQIQELYGAEVSESLISNITDVVIEDVKIWQKSGLFSFITEVRLWHIL